MLKAKRIVRLKMYENGRISDPDTQYNIRRANAPDYGDDYGFIAEKDGDTWYIRTRNANKPPITGFLNEDAKQEILEMLNNAEDDSDVTEETDPGSMAGEIEDDDNIPATNIEIGKPPESRPPVLKGGRRRTRGGKRRTRRTRKSRGGKRRTRRRSRRI